MWHDEISIINDFTTTECGDHVYTFEISDYIINCFNKK